MRARFAVLLAVLFCGLLCFQSLSVSSATGAPLSQLELGYSPGTLAPTSSGVPVYTYGDSIWAMASSQGISYSIQLLSPDGVVVEGGGLIPGAPILLHTFASGDVPGVWKLNVHEVGSSTVTPGIPILLGWAPSVQLNMTGDSISRSGVLSMNYTVSSVTTASDLSACAFGSLLPGIVSVPIPSSLGKGNMLVGLNGSNIDIAPEPGSGEVTNPFDLWVELYQNYSYTEGGGVSTMVTRDVQVAASSAVPISSGVTTTTAPYTPTIALRPGLFNLRLFYDSSLGFYAEQVPVLITNTSSPWISLQGCGATHQPFADIFTISSRLTQNNSLWPARVFLTYQDDGVEGYSVTPVTLLPSAVDVVAAPWGASFNDTELSLVPGPGVQSSASVNGTFFLVASHYPIEVGVSLLSGGEVQKVVISLPYYYTRAVMNSSKLVVVTKLGSQGTAAPGTNLTISTAGAIVARGTANATGESTFYLPPGTYNVAGEYKNFTEGAAPLVATPSQASRLALIFPGPSNQPGVYGEILLASTVIGMAVAIAVWTMVYLGRRSETATSSRFSPAQRPPSLL